MTSTDALELALRTAAWIDAARVETENGSAWLTIPAKSAPPLASLYAGSAGIIIFLVELFETTGDEHWIAIAESGANDLFAKLEADEDLTAGLYRGLTGAAFVFEELSSRTTPELHRSRADRCLGRVQTTSVERGGGRGWIQPIPFADAFGVDGSTEVWDVSGGSAGIGLGLLRAHEKRPRPDLLELAVAIGERLIEVSEEAGHGRRWQMMERDVGWTAPNFSHGTAGIAYYLARLHEATGDDRYLDAALEGADHLRSIATVKGESRSIFHNMHSRERLYYQGWCHGPVGTGRLFFQLARATGDPSWLDWTYGGGVALLETGAPEKRSRGLWNNVGQCCGDAGIGDHALNLYGLGKDVRLLELAERIGSHLARAAESDSGGAAFWSQAEHRTRRHELEAQTGYMQGAAGVGSFLLSLHAVRCGTDSAKIHFPDSPFGDGGA